MESPERTHGDWGAWLAIALTALVAVGCAQAQATPSPTPAPPFVSAEPAASGTPAPELCQPGEPDCIGELAPGIHTTANLLIPMTFEVPAGWQKTLDVAGSVNIGPLGGTGFIGILPDWAIANQAECTGDPEPNVGTTADDLVAWIADHPGLLTSMNETVSLDGLSGHLLEVRVNPDEAGPCAVGFNMFTHQSTLDDVGWWTLFNEEAARLHILDAGGGHTVTVHVQAPHQDFEEFVELATPVVESFVFETTPHFRGYHELVTVESMQGVLLFGGFTSSPPDGGVSLHDSWFSSSPSAWTRADLKPMSFGTASAYDSASDRVVSFAIVGPVDTSVNETWSYDPAADSWTAVGNNQPEGMHGARAAYDAESDRIIVVAPEPGRTWAYDVDTDTWEELSRHTAGIRGFHGIAYDSESDRVVAFGGGHSDRPGVTATYDYNSDTWTDVSTDAGPTDRAYQAMAYDPTTDRVIMFGGAGAAEAPTDETWAFDTDTSTWSLLSPSMAPTSRGWASMALNPVDNTLVLFGGGSIREEYTAETWIFDPATDEWTGPRP